LTSVRKMVAQYDLRPQKRLGQSFLEDLNIVHRIVELAQPAGHETIVEIGAGLGFMTEELAKNAGRVIALEVDPRLAGVLRERFTGQDRVEILQTDVLKYDFSSACSGGRIKVVGNIPYHISTPILFRLLGYRRSISTMLLMMQRELANRITASPGTKDYGIPSVLMTVKQTSDTLDDTLFSKIVRAAFAQRRKTLRNNFRHIGIPEDMAAQVFNMSGIDRTRRAETLSVEEFSLLTKAWTETSTDSSFLSS
jgi:16S rRNA (adenine1518-N6/adenine1519-N6)-dimethyltransferase